jgi:hypothetical protein
LARDPLKEMKTQIGTVKSEELEKNCLKSKTVSQESTGKQLRGEMSLPADD